MNRAERLRRVGGDLVGIPSRAHATVAEVWHPSSLRGLRQFGEVVLDELVLTGWMLTSPPPTQQCPTDRHVAAGAERAGLGVSGAHSTPNPLQPATIRRHRFANQSYERVTFEHDPKLPATLAAQSFGGPATAVVHLCRRGDERRPWLVWMHQGGQGFDLTISRARRIRDTLGFNVALPVQPGSGVLRRADEPAYPTLDPMANVAGMMRAVSEVRAVVRWLRPQANAIAVAGVSVASGVAGLVAHFEPVEAVAAFTPAFGLNGLIAANLQRWGPKVQDTVRLLDSDATPQAMSAIDYLGAEPSPPPRHRLIVGARYDRMVTRHPALALHERWGGRLYWHDGSHLGHLFAPGVQQVSDQFLRQVRDSTG